MRQLPPFSSLTVLLLMVSLFCSPAVSSSKSVEVLRRGSPLFKKLNSRIFGGSDAADGDAPHQVALFKNGQFICGGSLISPKTVLTAAHCVYEDENSPAKFLVRYGHLKLYNGTAVAVSAISRHPLYDSYLIDYDVALLHLASPIVTGANAAVIALAEATPANGSLVTISGFGYKDFSEPLLPAEHLQVAAQMAVMDHDQCEHDWSSAALPITDRILCVISDNQTALPGDSGGPMVFGGRLVGVTSFIMIDLGSLAIMDAYSNVATLRPWIEANMNNGATTAVVGQSALLLAFVLLVVGRFVHRW